MRKLSMVIAVLLVGSGLVAGCGGGGGSSSSAYCKTLKSAASNIKSFTGEGATPDFAKFDDFIATAHKLKDQAPSKIKDDWTVLAGAMDQLTSALDEAGLKIEDIASIISTGQIPEGVDPSKLAGLTSQLQKLGGDDVKKAGEAIRKQAKTDCDVDLSKVT
jgi:hypothetical protein